MQALAHLPLKGTKFSSRCNGLDLGDVDAAAAEALVAAMTANLLGAVHMKETHCCSIVATGAGSMVTVAAVVQQRLLTESTQHIILEVDVVSKSLVAATSAVAPSITCVTLNDCKIVAADAWPSFLMAFPKLTTLVINSTFKEVRW